MIFFATAFFISIIIILLVIIFTLKERLDTYDENYKREHKSKKNKNN